MRHFIFIYQANSGIRANIPGAIAKAFGGKSICSLCNITHGPIHERPEWEQFIASLTEKPEIYHADEVPAGIAAFLQRHGYGLPVVLEQDGDQFSLVVSSDEIATCNADPACLIVKLKRRGDTHSCRDGVCAMKLH